MLRCLVAVPCEQESLSALNIACVCGHYDVAHWLVTGAGLDPQARSAVVGAASDSRFAAGLCTCDTKLLLLLMCTTQSGSTALTMACRGGNRDIVKWLMEEHKLNPLHPMVRVSTPAIMPKSHIHVCTVWLSTWRVQVNNTTSLSMAQDYGRDRVVRYLLTVVPAARARVFDRDFHGVCESAIALPLM